jgi:hypothetical protein
LIPIFYCQHKINRQADLRQSIESQREAAA